MNINEAVLKYEVCRQAVSRLSKERIDFLSKCVFSSIDNGFKTCGNIAWDELTDHNSHSEWCDIATFQDYFFNYINNGEGACQNCIKAWEIKTGTLRLARHDFGVAKRSIAHHGKNLIKAELCSK